MKATEIAKLPTPETDHEEDFAFDDGWYVRSPFARTLEQKLAAAVSILERVDNHGYLNQEDRETLAAIKEMG